VPSRSVAVIRHSDKLNTCMHAGYGEASMRQAALMCHDYGQDEQKA